MAYTGDGMKTIIPDTPKAAMYSFGHLLPKTELFMFGPALVAIFAGFFEVMMREKTGLPRPTLGQLIPSRGASNDQLANRR